MTTDLSTPFQPITVTPMPEDASNLRAIKHAIRNPAELWSDHMYRSFIWDNRFLGQRIVHVSDPEIIQGILLTHQSIFPKSEIEQMVLERATGVGLLTAEGRQWKTQRKATSPVFRHVNLMELAPSMLQAGRDAAAKLTARAGETDVLPVMTSATLQIIANTLLSGEEDQIDFTRIASDVETLLEHLGKIDVLDLIPLTRKLPKPWGFKGKAAVKRLRADADKVIALRRASGKDSPDLLSMLMAAEDPDNGRKLSDIELRDNIITFIGAGHETTSLALTWALYLLAGHPEWQEKLADEAQEVCGDGAIEPHHIDALKTHEAVLKEAMRLYPPAPAMDRVALEDVTLEGQRPLTLRKGDVVVLAIYPMHRHRKLWQAPGQFDPTRFFLERQGELHRFQFIPFSGGPRVCIGMKFAMMEAVSILANVVRVARFDLVAGFQPYPRSRITLRPTGGMRVRVTPRAA